MPLLHQIRLENLLSFGPNTGVLQLRPLNVLIGPNGSGKSNLIEVIGLLRSAAIDLAEAARLSGGVSGLIWNKAAANDFSTIEVKISWDSNDQDLKEYLLKFNCEDRRLNISQEWVCDSVSDGPNGKPIYASLDKYVCMVKPSSGPVFQMKGADLSRTVLSQLRDPDRFPVITKITEQLERVRLYREWSFGRISPARLPQRADGRNDYLEPDCSNLGMVLNRIRRDPVQKEQMIERLNDLYPGIKDVDVSIEGGTVQVFLTEGKFAMPATRLSDGTLRYLCLLAILLHPTPPPLICIEEPELGLHPDVMPAIGKLLKQASERTQLIVTTHSEVLVDSLSDSPEDVVVCEKHDGQTEFNRLDADRLKLWLDEYSLGTLWRRGDLGGNRW